MQLTTKKGQFRTQISEYAFWFGILLPNGFNRLFTDDASSIDIGNYRPNMTGNHHSDTRVLILLLCPQEIQSILLK
jgi:hypothetical protein